MDADFRTRLIIGALFITGIWTAFQPNMLFGRLGIWLNRLLPEWVTKPLFACPPCCASVWGTVVWFGTGGEWTTWPLYCMCLVGTMKIVSNCFLRNG